ncbi:hypothetical protein ACS126_16595 [Sphingobacterium lactis]|uniref:hypothetical protein n=1 Tax=Sphingobacterium hotanense TaxID=649196 RepID=UPI0021A31B68|nr:hypothetical protein [Sphingobacterium hotanense]MCT1523661.1 hypothetical protein [Sphingobacterium hotanense]
MEDHYEYIFTEKPIRIQDVLERLRRWITSALDGAQSAIQYDFENHASQLRQKLVLAPFFVDLLPKLSKRLHIDSKNNIPVLLSLLFYRNCNAGNQGRMSFG